MAMTQDHHGHEVPSRLRAAGTFVGACGAVVFVTSVLFSFAFPGASAWLTLVPIGVSLAALGFWISVSWRVIGERLSQRSGVYVVLTVLNALVLLALMTAVFFFLSRSPVSIDVTTRGIHGLSPQTEKLLGALQEDVLVSVFYERGSPEALLLDGVLAGYREGSARVSYRLLSPTRDIEEVTRYGVSQSGPRVYVEVPSAGGRAAGLTRFALDLAAMDHEEKLTNAIMKVTQRQRPRLYFLTGHQEGSLAGSHPEGFSGLAQDLVNEGYDVAELNLLSGDRIPADAAVVVVAGPQRALLPPEVEGLKNYLGVGGALALLLEPRAAHGVEGLLQSVGVQVNDDVVLDLSPFGTMFGGGPTTAVATEFSDHPITAALAGSNAVFARARSLSLNPGTAAETWALVRTGRYAWGESGDVEEGAEMAWDEGEVRGPVTLAVSAEQPSEGATGRPTRVFVSGDASFASNQYLSLSANRNLILNAIGWLAAQDDKVAIRPRRRGANLLVLSPAQREGIAFFVLYVLPVMLLSLGLGIWLVRRQR